MIVTSSPSVHPWARVKVALMSGQSDPACCALSEEQHEFLNQLRRPGVETVRVNFPYLPVSRSTQRAIPILVASWHNGSQFLGAHRSPYREHAAAHWSALANSCDRLLLITLSCGLQILNTCLSVGVMPCQMEVLALGPVAWRRPPVPHLLVRGRRDYVCNPWFRVTDHWLPEVGHMNYLQCPEVLDLARERLERLIGESGTGKLGCNSVPDGRHS